VRRRVRKLLKAGLVLLCLWFAGYTGTWLFWNDAAIARSINGWVSGNLRGAGGPTHQAFVLGRVHYPYWASMRGLFTSAPSPFEAWDAKIWDAEGREVIAASHLTGRIYLRTLVANQLLSLLHLQPFVLELHFAEVTLDPGMTVRIKPTSTGEMNLVQSFSLKKPKPPHKGGMHIQVDRLDFAGLDLTLAFPGWNAHLPKARGQGHLRYSSFVADNQPGKPAFTYRLAPFASDQAELRLGVSCPEPVCTGDEPGSFVFHMQDFIAQELGAPEEARDQMRFTATTRVEGAPAQVQGRLEGVYGKTPGTDLTIAFEHGQGLVQLLGLSLLGGDPVGRVRIHGPFAHIVFDGELDQAEVLLGGLVARPVGARFRLESSRLNLDPVHAAVAGGRVTGGVLVDFNRLLWQAQLRTEGVDPSRLGPLVPASLRPLVAGRLDGGGRLGGSINPLRHPGRVTIRDLDARLARRARDRLPATLQLGGGLRLWPELVHLDDLSVKGDGVQVSARGFVTRDGGRTDVNVNVDARLAELLARLGLPDLIERLTANARVTGPLLSPQITGNAKALSVGRGQMRLPEVRARVALKDGQLVVTDIQGEGLGGRLGGTAEDRVTIDLFDGSFSRPLAEPQVHARLRAEQLHLDLLGPPDVHQDAHSDIHADVSGRLTLDGQLAHPWGTFNLSLPQLGLYNDPYHDGHLDLELGEHGIEIAGLQLRRQGGGALSGSGHIGYDGTIAVGLDAVDFPLAAIPPLRDLPLWGTISGKVELSGNTRRWAPTGQIRVANVRVREFRLGDGQIELLPGADALEIKGEFFGGTFPIQVRGYLTLAPTLALNVTVMFKDLPLDDLIPELKELAEVEGLVSGQVRVSYATDSPARAEMRLDKMLLTLSSEDEEGVPGAERSDEFRNVGDVILTSDFTRLSFRQMRLASRRGDGFEMKGDVAAQNTDLRVDGHLNLALLEYFTAGLFEHTGGDAIVHARILGAAARPRVLGTVDFLNASLKPRGAHSSFQTQGKVVFDDKRVTLEGLEMELDQARTRANGWVELHNWHPGAVALDVKGKLPAELLEWFLGDYLSDVEHKGGFLVDAKIYGRWNEPRWRGRVQVDNIALRLRQNLRDIQLRQGTITLRDNELVLGCLAPDAPIGCEPVAARIDEHGDLKMNGLLRFAGLSLDHLTVHVDGDAIDWGSGQIYSLSLSPKVDLVGTHLSQPWTPKGKTQLRLQGEVYLVSGTYRQDYDVLRDWVIRPRAVETAPPFYEGIPLLENMALNITASSSGPLSIRNNLAPSGLQVSVSKLRIGGTLTQPTLAGTVSIDEGGAFRIPLLRADFITDRSLISFEANKHFPGETPRLDINASSDWTDRYEQLHHIKLRIFGTYTEPNLELSSNDGWDRNQVLSALATGSSPDDLRRSFQTDPTVARPASSTPTIVQTASSDLFFNFAEDPLKNVFKLEFLRIELGYVKACYYNRREFKLCGTGEGQLAPTSNLDARAELKLSDDVGAFLSAQHLENSIERSTEVINRLRLQLRWRLQLY
jgi:hypothetical protein